MSEITTLIGVSHQAKHLPETYEYLSKNSLSRRKVLTEFDDSTEKLAHEYYGPLVNFLLEQGAIILHEDGYDTLTDRSVSDYEKIHNRRHVNERHSLRIQRENATKESKVLRLIEMEGELLLQHLDVFFTLNSKYRNPNIVKLITIHEPDYVIMGKGHVREIYPEVKKLFLQRRMVSYVQIPEQMQNLR